MRVRAGCLHRERHDDGGLSEIHEGTLSIVGATYSFRISVFTDPDGDRFLNDILDFKPLGWTIGTEMPAKPAERAIPDAG